ncbi:MAG: hypothetical protein K0Q50_875 [Vampirovibrio sp.]|jgi:hypothetical protein|nr:hypothetical protein [Vampirovibrio sp.]
MSPDHEMPPQDDIQHALNQASQLSDGQPTELAMADLPAASDTLVHSKSCPLMGLRYGVTKCGLMAEKYPWQTTVACLLTVGCGWLCSYFGLTMLAGLLLYAVYAEE